MATSNPVPKFYRTVVEDVINNVRESFLDEGVDEQVLQEFKQLWESKLLQSKAVEGMPPDQDQYLAQYQALTQQQQSQKQKANIQPNIQRPGQGQPQQQQQSQVVNIPLFAANLGNTLDMSGAAATATIALPPQLYQQQLQNFTLQQTSDGRIIAVQQIPQGGQHPQGQPQVQPQVGQPVVVPTTGGYVQVPGGQQVAQVAQQSRQPPSTQPIIQLDGAHDTSSEEDDDNDDDDDDDDDDNQNDDENELGEEEDPLNSEDDIEDEEDSSEVFDSDNLVLCQYDKINRSKSKWKFHLKDGIMNLAGKDYVFQKANGDAEW